MQFRLFLVLLTSLLLASCHAASSPPDPAAVQKDLADLQGTWEIVFAQQAGTDVTKDCQARIPTLTFQNDAWLQDIDGHPLYIAENSQIRLNPSKTPKEIDHILKKVENGQLMTLMYPGIYEINGDSLKLCWDVALKQRPTNFASEAGDEFFFVDLKRVKPQAQE